MKNKLFLLICLIVISISLKANDKTVIAYYNREYQSVYKVGNNGRLYQSYVGQKLRFDSDIDQLPMLGELISHMVWKIILNRLSGYCTMTAILPCC